MTAMNEYVPAAVNVAVVLLAAFVSLALNVGTGAPAGCDRAAQVYVKLDSPPSSAPSTLRLTDVPVTVLEDAAAAVATVGNVDVGVGVGVGVSAGPVPLGVYDESFVTSTLSTTTPSSRIHRLSVWTPAVGTFTVTRTGVPAPSSPFQA